MASFHELSNTINLSGASLHGCIATGLQHYTQQHQICLQYILMSAPVRTCIYDMDHVTWAPGMNCETWIMLHAVPLWHAWHEGQLLEQIMNAWKDICLQFCKCSGTWLALLAHKLASRQGIHSFIKVCNQLEVSIEHIPRANVYGIECYNYSSFADSATPRDWLHHINAPCIEQENRVWMYWQWRWVCILITSHSSLYISSKDKSSEVYSHEVSW